MNTFLAFIFILAVGIFCVAEFTSATRIFRSKNKRKNLAFWSLFMWEVVPVILLGSLLCVGWIEFQKKNTRTVASFYHLLHR